MILPPKFDDSCVLWLDFASVKNNTVYDQSKYHNDGKVYGATHIGRFGLHGLHFDGVDDFIRIEDSASLNQTKEISIILLVKPQRVTTDYQQAILSKNDYVQYWVTFNTDGSFGFSLKTSGYNDLYPSSPVQLNKIYFVTAIAKANEIMKLFVNNKLTGEKTPKEGDFATSTNPLFIARPKQLVYHYFQGDIYFVALYNRALSDAEIRELYYYLTKGIRSIVPSRFVARKVR